MSLKIIILFLIAALMTATISGLFGMAGGLIFMGVIASVLGVSEAMVVHGAVASVSNSTRSFFLREHIRWDIYLRMGIGAVPALALLALVQFVPSKGVLFIVLGLLPGLLWVPKNWFSFDAQIPLHAALCGFFVTALNLIAGVAGPALDMFFVETELTRQEIVSTKAVAMFTSHLMKIVYFGIPLFLTADFSGLPPFWFFVVVVPFIIAGAYIGTSLLKKLSDVGFRKYTKWLVSVVGIIYILRGALFLGWI